MKFNVALIVLVFVLLGCATPPAAPTTKPVTISPPTLTPTMTPTSLPTLTPTPVKLAYEPITVDNIDRLTKIKTLGFGKPLDIRYTSDGKKIVLVTRENVCYLDSETLEVLSCIETYIRFASISNDAKTLAILNYDTLDVIDTSNGNVLVHEEIKAEAGPQWRSRSFSWQDFLSPDGKYVLAAAVDGLYVWSTQSGDLLQFFEGLDPVESYRFSADSKYLVLSKKNIITLWDLETKSDIGKIVVDDIPGHYRLGYSFSPQGTYVAISLGNSVHVYRISDQKHIWYWVGKSWISDVAFSGDASLISVATASDTNLNVWNLSTGNIVQKFRSMGHSDHGYGRIQISQDGKFVFAAGSPWSGNTCYSVSATDSAVYLWSVETGELIMSRPRPGLCDSLPIYFLFSPDSQSSLYFSEDPENITPADLNLFSLTDKSVVANLPLLLARSAVLKDENTLIVGSGDGRVFEMDILTGKSKPLIGDAPEGFDGSDPLMTIFAMSPDLQKIAVGTSDDRVLVVDLQNNATQEIWKGKGDITTVSFSPDGQYLAFNGDGILQIWDFAAKALLDMSSQIKANYLLYAPDGRYLIIVSNTDDFSTIEFSIWELPDLSKPIYSQKGIYHRELTVSHESDFFISDFIYGGFDVISILNSFSGDKTVTFDHKAQGLSASFTVGMALSQDDRLFAAWIFDDSPNAACRIEIWDVQIETKVKDIPVHCERGEYSLVRQLPMFFSADGTMLFAATTYGGIEIYGVK